MDDKPTGKTYVGSDELYAEVQRTMQLAAITAVATRKRGVSGSPSSRNDRAAPMKGAGA